VKALPPLMSLMLAVALFVAACGSDDVVTNEGAQPDPTAEPSVGSADERIETLWVGPQRADCVGVAPQECLQIKRAVDGQVEWFYDSIDGFDHIIGTSYQITVAVSDVENPPADASSLQYRIVEVVESRVERASAGLDGTSWTLRGFRDGELFDPVPDFIEISLAFDGDSVSGSAGCNNFMGSFTADGDVLSFGPLRGTKMLCPPQVMQQEDLFLDLMSSVETAEMTFDGTLVLAPTSGLTLVFGPAE
jgi:heat shock protein HslJ